MIKNILKQKCLKESNELLSKFNIEFNDSMGYKINIGDYLRISYWMYLNDEPSKVYITQGMYLVTFDPFNGIELDLIGTYNDDNLVSMPERRSYQTTVVTTMNQCPLSDAITVNHRSMPSRPNIDTCDLSIHGKNCGGPVRIDLVDPYEDVKKIESFPHYIWMNIIKDSEKSEIDFEKLKSIRYFDL